MLNKYKRSKNELTMLSFINTARFITFGPNNLEVIPESEKLDIATGGYDSDEAMPMPDLED